MRVLILNPPVPEGSLTNRDLMGGMGINDDFGTSVGARFVAFLKNRGTRMPVIALAYAAALLREHADVSVLDLGDRAPSTATLDEILRVRPDWIICATSFAYLGMELELLGKVHDRAGSKRLLLGATATHFADEILSRNLAECIADGDPEIAVRALVGSIGGSSSGSRKLPTLDASTDPKGKIAGTIHDLDTLPFPDWAGFPRDEYRYFPLLKKTPFLTLLSSRGCPYVCNFCPYPVAQGAAFRARSPRSVVAEMRTLVDRYGVASILFRDPTFSLDVERAKDICKGVLEAGLRVDWGIETRLDRFDDALIELLGKAGCRSVEFGVDPLEQETLKANHRRPLAPKKVAAVVQALEANGMRTAGLAVIGVPGQTKAEMRRTMDWVEELGLSYVNYEIATPFPGTPLYTEAVEKGWARKIELEDLLAGDPKLGFNGKVDNEEMRSLQDTALSRFYLKPRRIAREVMDGEVATSARFFTETGVRFLGRLLRHGHSSQ